MTTTVVTLIAMKLERLMPSSNIMRHINNGLVVPNKLTEARA